MKTAALFGLLLLLAGGLAGTDSTARASQPSRAILDPKPATIAGTLAAGGTKKCHWRWKRKKVVKWVRRKGRLKKVIRYRKVRVRVCRTVPVPAPARLGVSAWEFGFTLSAKRIAAGDTIIELNNRGEDSHDLHVQRLDGGEDLATPETAPGKQNRIRFVTTAGSYRLWCSLPTHAVRGMDTTFEATRR